MTEKTKRNVKHFYEDAEIAEGDWIVFHLREGKSLVCEAVRLENPSHGIGDCEQCCLFGCCCESLGCDAPDWDLVFRRVDGGEDEGDEEADA